jgi:hypothetical protein
VQLAEVDDAGEAVRQVEGQRRAARDAVAGAHDVDGGLGEGPRLGVGVAGALDEDDDGLGVGVEDRRRGAGAVLVARVAEDGDAGAVEADADQVGALEPVGGARLHGLQNAASAAKSEAKSPVRVSCTWFSGATPRSASTAGVTLAGSS